MWEKCFGKKVPLKCRDLGSFEILAIICNTKFGNAMLDLWASVNVMPTFLREYLSLGLLKVREIS